MVSRRDTSENFLCIQAVTRRETPLFYGISCPIFGYVNTIFFRLQMQVFLVIIRKLW